MSFTRRTFVRSAAAMGLALPALAPVPVRAASPNGKMNHAAIGVGGKGWSDLLAFASSGRVHVAAICDVDLTRRRQAEQKFPDARRYQDWRELLAKEGDRIDSVNVTTPDHMHAPITMTALKAGKHVYCQKPLTHDIYEARQVAAAAVKAGVTTQMGTQLASGNGNLMSVALIENGAIGKVKRAYLWSNKNIGNYRPHGPRPAKADAVPDHVNWDHWLGTAPVRPYVRGVYHPTWWRGWQDFGCGWLGDMGCHIMDMPYRSLKLSMPLSIKATVEDEWKNNAARRKETFPRWQIVDYIYPGTERTVGDTIQLTWLDGYKYPPDEVRKHMDGEKFPAQAALLIGESGSLLLPHGRMPKLFPVEKFKDYPYPKLRPRNHYHDWVKACFDGETTRSNFAYAGPMTEMVLAGTIALRFPDQTLQWDAAGMSYTNVAEANRYVRRTYRAGWEVKGL